MLCTSQVKYFMTVWEKLNFRVAKIFSVRSYRYVYKTKEHTFFWICQSFIYLYRTYYFVRFSMLSIRNLVTLWLADFLTLLTYWLIVWCYSLIGLTDVTLWLADWLMLFSDWLIDWCYSLIGWLTDVTFWLADWLMLPFKRVTPNR